MISPIIKFIKGGEMNTWSTCMIIWAIFQATGNESIALVFGILALIVLICNFLLKEE